MQRRRFIQILATSVAGASIGRSLSATSHPLQAVQWNGYTMGAEGRFTLYTHLPQKAQKVLKFCFQEIQRLEKRFSLYDSDSEISQLNRDGQLIKPSKEWLSILDSIASANAITGHLFDPTIQPVWKAYTGQRSKFDSINPAAVSEALKHVGWKHVNYDSGSIQFSRANMQLTLNGIAQGFITDRITHILKDSGYTHVLVELGETRAIGNHPKQRPWNVGIKDALSPVDLHTVAELNDNALATSGGYGTPLASDGSIHHLINPLTGRSSTPWKSLSVIAPTATEADALSTGLSFANEALLQDIVETRPDIQIIKQA